MLAFFSVVGIALALRPEAPVTPPLMHAMVLDSKAASKSELAALAAVDEVLNMIDSDEDKAEAETSTERKDAEDEKAETSAEEKEEKSDAKAEEPKTDENGIPEIPKLPVAENKKQNDEDFKAFGKLCVDHMRAMVVMVDNTYGDPQLARVLKMECVRQKHFQTNTGVPQEHCMDFSERVQKVRYKENMQGAEAAKPDYLALCRHYWDINHPVAPPLQAKPARFNFLMILMVLGAILAFLALIFFCVSAHAAKSHDAYWTFEGPPGT